MYTMLWMGGCTASGILMLSCPQGCPECASASQTSLTHSKQACIKGNSIVSLIKSVGIEIVVVGI